MPLLQGFRSFNRIFFTPQGKLFRQMPY
jgi:hypothetical protein